MKANVEVTDPLHRTITIELPWEMIQEELDREYDDLKKKIAIKGFRKGKIPRTVLRQRFGKKVNADVLGRLVQDAYEAALIQNKIKPVSLPDVERGEFQEGKDYNFIAKVEVQPEIELKQTEGFEIEIDKPETTDELIDEGIKRLRESRAVLVPVEDREVAQLEDTVIIDYKAFRDGEPVEGGQKDDHEVELGSKVTIPGFEDEICGMKVGEHKEFELRFPEGYANDLANALVAFHVDLKALKQKDIPELDDEFAKDLGETEVQTVADVKNMVKRRVEEGLHSKYERDAKTKLLDKLLEANPFPVPAAMVERQKASMLHEVQTMLEFQGMNPDQISASTDKMLEDIAPRAEKEVASALLLSAVAERDNITISDAEIDQHIDKVAERSGENIARLKALYNEPKRIEELRASLKRDKVVDHLMKLSKTKPMSAQEEQDEQGSKTTNGAEV